MTPCQNKYNSVYMKAVVLFIKIHGGGVALKFQWPNNSGIGMRKLTKCLKVPSPGIEIPFRKKKKKNLTQKKKKKKKKTYHQGFENLCKIIK